MSPFALALFCEDIRTEEQGINSLIGILPDNVDVDGANGLLAKFCIYVRINLDPKSSVVPVRIDFTDPNGVVVVSNPVKPETVQRALLDSQRDNIPYAGLISRMVFSPFQINFLGRWEAKVVVGSQALLAGSIQFREAK